MMHIIFLIKVGNSPQVCKSRTCRRCLQRCQQRWAACSSSTTRHGSTAGPVCAAGQVLPCDGASHSQIQTLRIESENLWVYSFFQCQWVLGLERQINSIKIHKSDIEEKSEFILSPLPEFFLYINSHWPFIKYI